AYFLSDMYRYVETPVKEFVMNFLSKTFCSLLLVTGVLLSGNTLAALGEPGYVIDTPAPGAVHLVHKRELASLYRDENADSAITLALDHLQADIKRVTGKRPALTHKLDELSAHAVIVGEIGKSALIDRLIAEQKIQIDEIENAWEGYVIQTVSNPLPGVEQALVVAGSDRRGTAYGIYDIS